MDVEFSDAPSSPSEHELHRADGILEGDYEEDDAVAEVDEEEEKET